MFVLIFQGDGQCDSPGHSAKYCQVSFLEIESEKILGFKLFQKTMSSNSASMERDGTKAGLEEFQQQGKTAAVFFFCLFCRRSCRSVLQYNVLRAEKSIFFSEKLFQNVYVSRYTSP